jgi:hypothetical protein
MVEKKEITDYFRSNIFEAYGAYLAWKMIAHSKSMGIVPKEMAERYVEIQNYHAGFFVSAERAFLINFVLLSLHPFDTDTRAFSLLNVDAGKTKAFIEANKFTLDMLYPLRNKIFAHGDTKVKPSTLDQYKIPSVEDLDQFFKNLIQFYNELTLVVDESTTIFSNAEDAKNDIEYLFMNLYRGEHARRQEDDIKYLWEESNKKASDVL